MRYEVVTSPGMQYPVGAVIETENLHPSMIQHVRAMDKPKRAPVEADDGGEVDTREQDPDKAQAAAIKINKAMIAKAAVKPGDSENT